LDDLVTIPPNKKRTEMAQSLVNPLFQPFWSRRYRTESKKSASGRKLLVYTYDLNGNHSTMTDVTGKCTGYNRGDHNHNFGIYHPTGKGVRDIFGGGKAGRKGKIK